MLVVVIHGVQPRAADRVRTLRTMLRERGIDRVTLLVVPAPDLHPFGARSPELAAWLRGTVAGGDAVALHGFGRGGPHERRRRFGLGVRRRDEFDGIDPAAARARLTGGLRLLRDLELDPRGVVAPAYRYPQPLRTAIADLRLWHADARTLITADGTAIRAVAHRLPPRDGLAAGPEAGGLLRIDLTPDDLDRCDRMRRLARLLDRAGGRRAVTLDDLATGERSPATCGIPGPEGRVASAASPIIGR